MMIDATKYGPFHSVVSAAGSLMAMVVALSLGWRGRSNWEPAEEDIPSGPQKVGGLIAACIVGMAWAELSDLRFVPLLTRISMTSLVITLLALVTYGLLVNGLIYTRVLSRTASIKVIGGLWKTENARKAQRENAVTTQELFAGAQYNADRVWPRIARGLSKTAFVLSYLALTVGGTVALGCVSIVVGLKTK